MSDLHAYRRPVESLARIDISSLERLRTVVRLLKKDDAINALLQSCNSVGEAFLFGGMVRDALLGSSGVFGDVDIFVSGPLNAEFAESVARTHRRTNFGGMRLVVGKYDVDIWELAKSRAFSYERGPEKSIRGLLSTVCFSTDAVAVSLVTGHVLADSRFNKVAKTRIFEFVSRPRDLEVLQVVRIARITVKNGVKPGPDVARYFVDGVDRFGIEGLVSAEGKWKGRRLLDARLVHVLYQWCSLSISGREHPERPSFEGEALFPSVVDRMGAIA